MESVVVDDLNFFLSFFIPDSTTAKQPSNRDGLPPHPTHSTHSTYLRIFVFDTYLIASWDLSSFSVRWPCCIHACMHTYLGTASHGFLVLPCQKLPHIPEIKIVRKVKGYLPYLPVSKVTLSIGFPKEAKKVVESSPQVIMEWSSTAVSKPRVGPSYLFVAVVIVVPTNSFLLAV